MGGGGEGDGGGGGGGDGCVPGRMMGGATTAGGVMASTVRETPCVAIADSSAAGLASTPVCRAEETEVPAVVSVTSISTSMLTEPGVISSVTLSMSTPAASAKTDFIFSLIWLS